VNPSPTIAAVAERNINRFLERIGTYPPDQWPTKTYEWPTREYTRQREEANDWYTKVSENWNLSPPVASARPVSEPMGLAFDEKMQGFWADPKEDPGYDDAKYRRRENEGRPKQPVTLKLRASVRNLAAFFEAYSHELKIGDSDSGASTISWCVPGTDRVQTCKVSGTLQLMVEDPQGEPAAGVYRYKPYGLDRNDRYEGEAVRELEAMMSRRKYTTTVTSPGGDPEQRFMVYDLNVHDAGEIRWRVKGYKRLRDTASLDAWRDTSSLFLKLIDAKRPNGPPALAGVVHVELLDFLKQLNSVRVVTWNNLGQMTDTDPTLKDPLHAAWAAATFGAFFFGTLQRIYLPEFNSVLGTVGRVPHKRPNSVTP
jgi:hypothetical protein